MMIECEALTKTYTVREKPSFFSRGVERKIAALREVSFSISAGEMVGLLGPNRAGKTTLLKILSTLLVPDSGRAAIEGVDVLRFPRMVRQKIGLVLPSERSLYWKLTAQENLQLFAGLYNLSSRKACERSEFLLKTVGLSEFAHVPVEKFSTGMRKRLMIARALLHEPRLLILDEPSSGLDVQGKREIWSLLKDLATQQGVTLLLATHDMEEAETVPERLLIIHQGKIRADGSPSEIKALSGNHGWLFIDLPGTYSENRVKLPKGLFLDSIQSVDGGSRLCIRISSSYDLPQLLRIFPDATRVERREVSLADAFLTITGERFEDTDTVEEEEI
jgi:ABC-2 type transport system ATP-binding protein